MMKLYALNILFIFSFGPESGSSKPDLDDIHIHLHDIFDNDGNVGQVNHASEGKKHEGGYACRLLLFINM
jgi:hypothetical protein